MFLVDVSAFIIAVAARIARDCWFAPDAHHVLATAFAIVLLLALWSLCHVAA